MAELKVDQSFEAYLNDGPSDAQIKKVNLLLSSSKTTAAGWDLLNSILDHCPVDFFDESMTNWLDSCLQQHSQGNVTEIKLSIIEKFLEASIHNHDLSKKIVSDYLSKIVDFCLSSKRNCHEIHSSLDVLILSMKRYGSWFINRKIQIEKYILTFLESNSEFTVNKAAIAFLYLQQIGNAGADNINHKTNFKTAVQKLCATLHNLLDRLLESHTEINSIERPNQDGFTFEEPPLHSQKLVSSTAKRIKNVVLFLIIMLKKSFTTHKQIIPSDFLNVIVRGTATHYCVHSTPEHDADIQFFLILNDVQTQLLYLLKTLILWLGNSSLPYSFTISKLLIQSLKKSQKCKCFSFNCVYQEAIYNSLKTWIVTSKCGLNTHFQKELVQCIKKDITPVKPVVTLKIQMDKSKKQTLKNKPTVENTDTKNNNHQIKNNELKCFLALDSLTTLFSSSFIRIDKQEIQDLVMLVINIVNEINTSKCPHPFQSANNQQKLLELLVSFYEQETLNTLPLLPVSLNILNGSLCAKNKNVALACQKGLETLERLCQPVSIPFSTFSCTPVTSFSNDKEQIIGNDTVMLECFNDTNSTQNNHDSTPSKEIVIIENRILPERLKKDITEVKIKSNDSIQLLNESSESDMSISYSCSNTNKIQSNVTVNPTISESDQLLQKLDSFIGTENEPTIKRLKLGVKEIEKTENVSETPSINGNSIEHSSIFFEEFNSFVDEIKEDL